jgi:hypothetical protein
VVLSSAMSTCPSVPSPVQRCWRPSGFTTILFGDAYFGHCFENATLTLRPD